MIPSPEGIYELQDLMDPQPVTGACKCREPDDALLLRIYRTCRTARLVDERLRVLSRRGPAGFVLTGRGHEVAQVASVAAMRRGVDRAWPY